MSFKQINEAFSRYMRENISDEDPELSSEEQDIDAANIEARKRGQFKTGNQYRIQPKDEIEGQESIEDIGEEE